MEVKPDINYLAAEVINKVQFRDIFNIDEIQRFQDMFADIHGIASIIVGVDGLPITNPSNFSQLCNNIICKTEKGNAMCYQSEVLIGRHSSAGPIVRPCFIGGLWDASASITVGNKHIASWFIGQVRTEEIDELRIIHYSNEIGVSKNAFKEALNEIPFMSVEYFNKVSKMLFTFANELSEKANLKMQLNFGNNELKQAQEELAKLRSAEKELQASESFLKETQLMANLGIFTMDLTTGCWTSSEVLDRIFGIESGHDNSFDVWSSIVHPEWKPIMNDYLIREVKHNKTNFI